MLLQARARRAELVAVPGGKEFAIGLVEPSARRRVGDVKGEVLARPQPEMVERPADRAVGFGGRVPLGADLVLNLDDLGIGFPQLGSPGDDRFRPARSDDLLRLVQHIMAGGSRFGGMSAVVLATRAGRRAPSQSVAPPPSLDNA